MERWSGKNLIFGYDSFSFRNAKDVFEAKDFELICVLLHLNSDLIAFGGTKNLYRKIKFATE